MKIQKLAMSLAAACLLCLSPVFAFEEKDISLGGIAVGASKGYVHSIYGEPDSTKTTYTDTPYGTTRIDYIEKYGNSVDVDYWGLVGKSPITDNSRVFSIKITANNGWATKQGATVGMDESKLREIYGNRFFKFVDEDGITCYDYSANHSPMGYAFGIKNHKVIFILMSAGE